ncbi:PAS domain S-box protein [Puniceibacterium sediminis]|uniref:Sensor protein FixL n=1 Tax=Puniceibacterium sediminis TaxID=1608407 RepID=A0A238ZP18_9RHOB|nr:PAS domain S-box protein [Puniceibacterium sediminis]SNR84902.1 PAS/PAC sensor hybrid histidine kinase [Puniceibacterium sediminis]
MNTVDDRSLLLALLDAAVDAIIVSDRDGAILRLNKAAAELFGYSIEGLTGQNVRILMPQDMAVHHDGFLHHHLDTGEKRIIGIGRDVEGLRANGTLFPLHLSVGRADIEGQVAFVAILHDQSRRKAAEEAAARSQRMDAIGQMTGGIAHDFNNLLTVVIGNLELLEMSETAEKSRALITDALEAAELGADLTSRLMVFARKSTLQSEVIATNDAVSQSLAMLKRTIGSHISVEATLAEDLWPTRADATQLQTAVLNLALNAQDAMSAGGKIFLETRNIILDDSYVAQEIGVEPGNYVRLSVSDTGDGMSAETRSRAMEPFFTTKAVGEGTGLGLSMVYGFVKQSGGHLTIYSEVGQGTTISLYFPALIDIADNATLARKTDDVQVRIGSGQLVLVVEDDPRVMRLSEARLQAFGFNCITATTGDAAWDTLKDRDDIAMVFTDLVMPGKLSGHDLAKQIATSKPNVRVLMTSGFSEGVLQGGRIGADFAILRKPYRQTDLAEALQAVLEDR